MEQSLFREHIKRGLGSIILALRSNSNIEQYKDIVLWAALNDACYERYFENLRGEYLFEAITCFNDNQFFINELINKFNNPKLKNIYDFVQIANILFYFAINGGEHAQNVFYKKYYELRETILNSKRLMSIKKKVAIEQKMLEEICVWRTSLGGFDIFKNIVDDLLPYYLRNQNKKHFEWFWFFENSFDKFGSKRVLKYLQQKGIFYGEAKEKPLQEDKLSLEDVISFCNKKLSQKIRQKIRRFGRKAATDELLNVSESIINETNLNVKANLLEVFKYAPFCSDIKYLIEYSKTTHKQLKAIAFDVLREIVDDTIHDYAVELIIANKDISNAVILLCNNFRKNDASLLCSAIKKIKVSYKHSEWHSAFMDINSLIESNKHAPAEILEYMYSYTLCSYCRELIVKNIVKRKLPCAYRILEECRYDCNYDIRQFAERRLSSKTNE